MPFGNLAGALSPDDLDALSRVLERAALELPNDDRESLAAILIALRQNGYADEDGLFEALIEARAGQGGRAA